MKTENVVPYNPFLFFEPERFENENAAFDYDNTMLRPKQVILVNDLIRDMSLVGHEFFSLTKPMGYYGDLEIQAKSRSLETEDMVKTMREKGLIAVDDFNDIIKVLQEEFSKFDKIFLYKIQRVRVVDIQTFQPNIAMKIRYAGIQTADTVVPFTDVVKEVMTTK